MNNYRLFPVDLLPASVARFVKETTTAMNCDPAMIALPAISTLAGAIGMTREIVLRDDWREPAIVWTVIIARSGTMKTPGMETGIRPLADVEHRAQLENQAALADYQTKLLHYEKELVTWKRDKGGGDPPDRPEPPARKRFIVADTTLEALAPILAENPRGVLLARDELAAFLKGFNQYKSGKGSDAAAWLELNRAGRLSVDRKTGPATIYVPRAAVSVTGTIQPSIFATVMRGEHFDSGLAARILIAQPPTRQKRFTAKAPAAGVIRAYADTVDALTRLQYATGECGPLPVSLALSPDALSLWGAWYDAHAVRQHEAATDADAAALAKLEAYAARFALIIQLADDPAARIVGDDAMRRGSALADWFSYEVARVYAGLEDDDETAELRALVEWIGRKGGRVTPRDLCRARGRAYPTVSDAETALNGLVTGGVGVWDDPAPGPQGGRPSRVFVLTLPADETPAPNETDDTDVDKTPDGERETGVSSVSVLSERESPPIDRNDPASVWAAKHAAGIDLKAAHTVGIKR